MLDETNPQPTDPPTGTGGTGTNPREGTQSADAKPTTDPPTGTGGSGGSA